MTSDVALVAERERGGQDLRVTLPAVVPALAALLNQIRETHRAREDMLRAEQRLTLQIKAIERRIAGALKVTSEAAAEDHTQTDTLPQRVPSAAPAPDFDLMQLMARASMMHLEEARAVLHAQKLAQERSLTQLAKQLPVWPWVDGIRGFGAVGLGQIIGETGDLRNYGNPAKVWKRLGLAVLDGQRQRRVTDKTEAIRQGYSPRRRALMHVIGDSLIKNNADGVYRTCYLDRKEYERLMHGDLSDLQTHLRALRYMEKMLLKHLWQEWRAVAPA